MDPFDGRHSESPELSLETLPPWGTLWPADRRRPRRALRISSCAGSPTQLCHRIRASGGISSDQVPVSPPAPGPTTAPKPCACSPLGFIEVPSIWKISDAVFVTGSTTAISQPAALPGSVGGWKGFRLVGWRLLWIVTWWMSCCFGCEVDGFIYSLRFCVGQL